MPEHPDRIRIPSVPMSHCHRSNDIAAAIRNQIHALLIAITFVLANPVLRLPNNDALIPTIYSVPPNKALTPNWEALSPNNRQEWCAFSFVSHFLFARFAPIIKIISLRLVGTHLRWTTLRTYKIDIQV